MRIAKLGSRRIVDIGGFLTQNRTKSRRYLATVMDSGAMAEYLEDLLIDGM